MEQIYVLRCRDEHYYVGRSSNVDRRFAEHLDGRFGSEWTRFHPPIEIVEQSAKTSEFDESTKTLEYMKHYGIDRVRGAQWSNVFLTEEQRAAINAALNTSGCFKCGQHGHFARTCYVTNPTRKRKMAMRPVECNRCGRDSHLDDGCYAKSTIDGRALGCAVCGRTSHTDDQCFARIYPNGRKIRR